MPWVHHFGKIPIDKVNPSELVNEPWTENKGYTRQEYEQLMQDYVEIEERTDKGWLPDDFHRLALSSTPEDQRLCQSYQAHLEQGHGNAIRVEWDEGTNSYLVANGRHRLEVAREMGLQVVPGHIASPDQQTMDRLLAESSQLNNRHLLSHDGQASISRSTPMEEPYRPSWQSESLSDHSVREQSEEPYRSAGNSSDCNRQLDTTQGYSPSWTSRQQIDTQEQPHQSRER